MDGKSFTGAIGENAIYRPNIDSTGVHLSSPVFPQLTYIEVGNTILRPRVWLLHGLPLSLFILQLRELG